MRTRILTALAGGILLIAGYVAGSRTVVAHAGPANSGPENASSENPGYENPGSENRGVVPKTYGKLVAAIPDSIGTGLIFEAADGTIRFVSVTGMKEGELARYDKVATHGGIPKSYGHLVSAVVNNGATGLVFEDSNGVIRFVTLAGVTEKELVRN
jgi:hypothetical protein